MKTIDEKKNYTLQNIQFKTLNRLKYINIIEIKEKHHLNYPYNDDYESSSLFQKSKYAYIPAHIKTNKHAKTAITATIPQVSIVSFEVQQLLFLYVMELYMRGGFNRKEDVYITN